MLISTYGYLPSTIFTDGLWTTYFRETSLHCTSLPVAHHPHPRTQHPVTYTPKPAGAYPTRHDGRRVWQGLGICRTPGRLHSTQLCIHSVLMRPGTQERGEPKPSGKRGKAPLYVYPSNKAPSLPHCCWQENGPNPEKKRGWKK